jgi:hypothetical protein
MREGTEYSPSQRSAVGFINAETPSGGLQVKEHRSGFCGLMRKDAVTEEDLVEDGVSVWSRKRYNFLYHEEKHDKRMQ